MPLKFKIRSKVEFKFSLYNTKYCFGGHDMYNHNQFTDSQRLLYNFFEWILNVIFSLRSSVM